MTGTIRPNRMLHLTSLSYYLYVVFVLLWCVCCQYFKTIKICSSLIIMRKLTLLTSQQKQDQMVTGDHLWNPQYTEQNVWCLLCSAVPSSIRFVGLSHDFYKTGNVISSVVNLGQIYTPLIVVLATDSPSGPVDISIFRFTVCPFVASLINTVFCHIVLCYFHFHSNGEFQEYLKIKPGWGTSQASQRHI